MRAVIQRVLMALAFISAGAPGAFADRAAQVQSAFDDWLSAEKAEGALAIYRRGAEISVTGHGLAMDAPVELASLSKAITGVCAAELVRHGAMRWDDRFDQITGQGPALTLAQLVTQSGGLVKDSSQRIMRRTFGAPWKDAAEQVLGKVIARDAPKGRAGQFAYSNENYALAGLMIEAKMGGTYEDICHTRAIAPAHVTATLSPDAGAFASWGGWQMSVADYAKWHSHWFTGPGQIAQAPLAQPFAQVSDGAVYYGLGSYFRAMDRGNTFWHFGALCFPGRMNAGGYAVSLFGDWTIVAAYEACVDWEAMFALDRALVGALFAVPE